MKRLRAWIGAAILTIPLFMSLGAEGVQAAPLTDVPLPLPSGGEQSVRLGEQVSVSVGLQDAVGNGDRVFSEAFTADGRMRMNDPHVTAVMTISCTAAPGSYEVRIGAGGDRNPAEVTRLWGASGCLRLKRRNVRRARGGCPSCRLSPRRSAGLRMWSGPRALGTCGRCGPAAR